MKEFRIDGKTHAVNPEDVIIMDGPAIFEGKQSGSIITLKLGDTLTLLCSNLAPGEAVTITCDIMPATTFFRPLQDAVEQPVQQSEVVK